MTKGWNPGTPVEPVLERRQTVLTSKARRRLAQKTSALGIASMLAFVTGSALLSSPAAAQADLVSTCTATSPQALEVPVTTGTPVKSKQVSYTCTGNAVSTSAAVSVTFSVSVDTVPTTRTFDVSVAVPALTLQTAPTTATTMKVNQAFTVTGGTVETVAKDGGAVTAQSTSVPAKTLTYKVTVPTTTTDKVSVLPGALTLTVPSSTGGGDEVAQYNCKISGETDQFVDVKYVITPPTTAKTNEDISFTATLAYDVGSDLLAPTTGLPTGSKLFAHATIAGVTVTTQPTGEATVTAPGADGKINLPSSITLKGKVSTTSTSATIKAGNLNFGTTNSSPAIKCELQNAGQLKAYTFTVTAGNGTSQSPSPSATTTSATPKPTKTTTKFVTETPKDNGGKVTKTPKAGADTGGGGGMGPDGRMFILTGSLLILAAGVGGLVMRRRGLSRG
ncbi:hypothetical protein [Nonomuraea typhae]|uniref:LPXTG cell wall anchor domain-containing protein n=1 Tax=Nonomuraea typhae TaxID=2603600 RepID=A0ABW7Z146_9ACTN